MRGKMMRRINEAALTLALTVAFTVPAMAGDWEARITASTMTNAENRITRPQPMQRTG
jgi:hypothetical protein